MTRRDFLYDSLSPFYFAPSIFAVFRNLVREIWFENSGSKKVVDRKKNLSLQNHFSPARKKNPSLQNHFSQTIFLEPDFLNQISKNCKNRGCRIKGPLGGSGLKLDKILSMQLLNDLPTYAQNEDLQHSQTFHGLK